MRRYEKCERIQGADFGLLRRYVQGGSEPLRLSFVKRVLIFRCPEGSYCSCPAVQPKLPTLMSRSHQTTLQSVHGHHAELTVPFQFPFPNRKESSVLKDDCGDDESDADQNDDGDEGERGLDGKLGAEGEEEDCSELRQAKNIEYR